MKNYILFLLLFLLAVLACRDMSPVDPKEVENEKAKGIFLNKNFLRPAGIDTLFINEGDTVEIAVETILINDPTYDWTSADESVLKIMTDPNHDSLAYALAMADSGNQTSLTLNDNSNDASKTIPVVIVKYWADPMMFNYIGSLEGHYYYISRYKKTWTEAKSDCELNGGHLLTITSSAENKLVARSNVRNQQEVWIGMTFLFGNNNLRKWITGEDVSYQNFDDKPTSPGIFAKYYFYMSDFGKWENWHEISYNYILEME